MVSGGGGQKSLWINCSTYVINKKSSSHYYLGIPTSIFSFAFPVPTKMVFCFHNCSDLLWEKNVRVIEKFFWNSMLKAENFLRTLEQFIKTIKGQNNSWNRMFFTLFQEVSQLLYIRTILIQIGKNNWDSETNRKSKNN